MRLLLDQGVGRTAEPLLRDRGFDTDHVGSLGLGEAMDEVILETARGSGAVVVTFDHDLHQILALTGASKPSVIMVRDEHLKSPALVEIVATTCWRIAEALENGAAVTIRRGLARVRPLPMGASR